MAIKPNLPCHPPKPVCPHEIHIGTHTNPVRKVRKKNRAVSLNPIEWCLTILFHHSPNLRQCSHKCHNTNPIKQTPKTMWIRVNTLHSIPCRDEPCRHSSSMPLANTITVRASRHQLHTLN